MCVWCCIDQVVAVLSQCLSVSSHTGVSSSYCNMGSPLTTVPRSVTVAHCVTISTVGIPVQLRGQLAHAQLPRLLQDAASDWKRTDQSEQLQWLAMKCTQQIYHSQPVRTLLVIRQSSSVHRPLALSFTATITTVLVCKAWLCE